LAALRLTPADLAAIILNRNGRAHLGPCLEAVLALDDLPGPAAVWVADNGSTDGSLEWLGAQFPGVRTLAFDQNLGFAEGNNRAAAAVAATHVLFLNNDTRIAPGALGPLWQALEAGATCAGARLVSWDGRRLDFDGGGASLTGHGHALGFGRPVPPATPGAADAARPTLFASGAALLVHRRTFLDLGGFDPDYFAYLEDVDLGWRLWLAGHEVAHVPAAVVRHRHHGSAGQLARGTAARLVERNALATVMKVYADAHLGRVLPAALALAAHRAGAAIAAITAADPRPGAWPPVPPPEWAGWPALAPLELDFGRLLGARAAVQARRRRPDGEVLPLLGQPYAPVPPSAVGRRALRLAVAHFDLEAVFGPLPVAEAGGAGALVGRSWRALRLGGPGWWAREVQRYLAWRRAGRP
jgi:GT2 family glycosyltransferase